MAKVGVVLSGCGFQDGAEIQEAVLTLYFLERQGIEVKCFAPDKAQTKVVDHLTGKQTDETRNVLVESARIVRGEISALREASMDSLDALVLPGGFGVALNLSNFVEAGPEATLDPDFTRLIGEAAGAKKPIVAICISPAVLAVALNQAGVQAELTIGNDPGAAGAIEASGCSHTKCPVEQAIIDQSARIVSTPAYMLGKGPHGVGAGIESAIATLKGWLESE